MRRPLLLMSCVIAVLCAPTGPASAQDVAPLPDPAPIVLPGEEPPTDPAPAPPSEPATPTDPGPDVSPAVERKLNPNAITAAVRLSGPTVPGTRAALRANGTAIPPASAPLAVKRMIWTANRLIGLRYRYGGGHRSFADSSYDCSGAVSYAVHAAALLDWPLDSGSFTRWGEAGAGRWVTIYANSGHAYMTIAGLRLDTSPVADPGGLDGPRWRPSPRPATGFHRRHPAGL